MDIRDSSTMTDEHKRPVLAKIYRSFISEMVALFNDSDIAKEVNIHGDCVWCVCDTPWKTNIDELFSALCAKIGISPDSLTVPAGIEMESAANLQAKAKGDFESLLFSRHSIRYFENKIPSKNLVEEALKLSAQTPSACNRQAWHTHVDQSIG